MKLSLSRSEKMVRYGPKWMIWNAKRLLYSVHARLELTPEETKLFWEHNLDHRIEVAEEAFMHASFSTMTHGGMHVPCQSIDEVVFAENAIFKACEALKSRFAALGQSGQERIIDFDE